MGVWGQNTLRATQTLWRGFNEAVLGLTQAGSSSVQKCATLRPHHTPSIPAQDSPVAGTPSRESVHRESAGLREGLAACIARVGLVARVHPKVHREIVTCRSLRSSSFFLSFLSLLLCPAVLRTISSAASSRLYQF